MATTAGTDLITTTTAGTDLTITTDITTDLTTTEATSAKEAAGISAQEA